jgi:hypothetical protein
MSKYRSICSVLAFLIVLMCYGCDSARDTYWSNKLDTERKYHADSIRFRDLIIAKQEATILMLNEKLETPMNVEEIRIKRNNSETADEVQEIEFAIHVLEQRLQELKKK